MEALVAGGGAGSSRPAPVSPSAESTMEGALEKRDSETRSELLRAKFQGIGGMDGLMANKERRAPKDSEDNKEPLDGKGVAMGAMAELLASQKAGGGGHSVTLGNVYADAAASTHTASIPKDYAEAASQTTVDDIIAEEWKDIKLSLSPLSPRKGAQGVDAVAALSIELREQLRTAQTKAHNIHNSQALANRLQSKVSVLQKHNLELDRQLEDAKQKSSSKSIKLKTLTAENALQGEHIRCVEDQAHEAKIRTEEQLARLQGLDAEHQELRLRSMTQAEELGKLRKACEERSMRTSEVERILAEKEAIFSVKHDEVVTLRAREVDRNNRFQDLSKELVETRLRATTEHDQLLQIKNMDRSVSKVLQLEEELSILREAHIKEHDELLRLQTQAKEEDKRMQALEDKFAEARVQLERSARTAEVELRHQQEKVAEQMAEIAKLRGREDDSSRNCEVLEGQLRDQQVKNGVQAEEVGRLLQTLEEKKKRHAEEDRKAKELQTQVDGLFCERANLKTQLADSGLEVDRLNAKLRDSEDDKIRLRQYEERCEELEKEKNTKHDTCVELLAINGEHGKDRGVLEEHLKESKSRVAIQQSELEQMRLREAESAKRATQLEEENEAKKRLIMDLKASIEELSHTERLGKDERALFSRQRDEERRRLEGEHERRGERSERVMTEAQMRIEQLEKEAEKAKAEEQKAIKDLEDANAKAAKEEARFQAWSEKHSKDTWKPQPAGLHHLTKTRVHPHAKAARQSLANHVPRAKSPAQQTPRDTSSKKASAKGKAKK